MKKHILLICAATLVCGPVSAKEMLGVGTPDAKQFEQKVASSDAFEIASSKIALTHAANPEVKKFAEMMIKDHTASSAKLRKITHVSKDHMMADMMPAADGKYKANMLFDSSKADELNSLASKSNADFDKSYIDDQVSGHKDAVALLQDYAKNGDNADLKTLAIAILPTVETHSGKANALKAAMK